MPTLEFRSVPPQLTSGHYPKCLPSLTLSADIWLCEESLLLTFCECPPWNLGAMPGEWGKEEFWGSRVRGTLFLVRDFVRCRLSWGCVCHEDFISCKLRVGE